MAISRPLPAIAKFSGWRTVVLIPVGHEDGKRLEWLSCSHALDFFFRHIRIVAVERRAWN